VPLDPKKYPPANQPWPYKTVAANLTAWGYAPVGDHSLKHMMKTNGFLRWDKKTPASERKKTFVISNPKWSAKGYSEPVWPASVVTAALVTQEVYQRAGSSDHRPTGNNVPLILNDNGTCK
jgi:hypothetical protein